MMWQGWGGTRRNVCANRTSSRKLEKRPIGWTFQTAIGRCSQVRTSKKEKASPTHSASTNTSRLPVEFQKVRTSSANVGCFSKQQNCCAVESNATKNCYASITRSASPLLVKALVVVVRADLGFVDSSVTSIRVRAASAGCSFPRSSARIGHESLSGSTCASRSASKPTSVAHYELNVSVQKLSGRSVCHHSSNSFGRAPRNKSLLRFTTERL